MRRRLMACLACLSVLPLGLAAQEGTAQGPRAGKYRIMSYGATTSAPLFLGSFVLGAGTYKAYLPGDKPSGEGRYAYDPSTHTVTWKTGPYAGVWGGDFTTDRGGLTHKIRLKRTTIGTNSKDAP